MTAPEVGVGWQAADETRHRAATILLAVNEWHLTHTTEDPPPVCTECGTRFERKNKGGPHPRYCGMTCGKRAYWKRYRRRLDLVRRTH